MHQQLLSESVSGGVKMMRSERWVVTLAATACLIGAALALSTPWASAHNTKAIAPTKRVAVSPVSSQELKVTRAVVEAANKLTESIAKARAETSTVLASSFNSLASSQSTLAAERTQLAIEAQQLASRAAALTSEEKTLQREAASIRVSQAKVSQTSPTNTIPAGGTPQTYGDGGGNDH
jgi:uncharacterized protein (DUF3084 family)